MSIFAAWLTQETNTFSPLKTNLDSFTIIRPEDVAQGRKRLEDLEPLGIWQQKARDSQQLFHFGMAALAQPAGMTDRSTYESLRDEILTRLRDSGPVDSVLLLLHGAMIAEGYEDCEGDLLQHIRRHVGIDVVIAVELDLHCHLSELMLSEADIIITLKEYPHIDIADRGRELFDLAMAYQRGEIKPVMASFDCKMMGLYPTSDSNLRPFVDKLHEIERQSDAVLSVSFVHGFPWGDIADAGSKMLVVTDNNPELAQALAQELGLSLLARRHDIGFDALPLEEALNDAKIATAPNETGGCKPVVIADLSDNPGGGAPGDSTFALEWLLANSQQDVAMAIFYDPDVVELAFEGGMGALIPISLGGKFGDVSGFAVELEAEVLGLEENYQHLWPQQNGNPIKWPLGDTVGIRCRGLHCRVDIIVSSERGQCYSPGIFDDLGIVLRQKRIIVLKSMQHFYNDFFPIAKNIIYMTAPGALTLSMKDIAYQKLNTNEIFPWVDDPYS